MCNLLDLWYHTKKDFSRKFIPCKVNLILWSKYTQKMSYLLLRIKMEQISSSLMHHESMQVTATRENSPFVQERRQAQRSHSMSVKSWSIYCSCAWYHSHPCPCNISHSPNHWINIFKVFSGCQTNLSKINQSNGQIHME